MTTTLTVKLLPAHRQALETLATREQEPIAVIVRRLIKAEAEKWGVWPPKAGESCAN